MRPCTSLYSRTRVAFGGAVVALALMADAAVAAPVMTPDLFQLDGRRYNVFASDATRVDDDFLRRSSADVANAEQVIDAIARGEGFATRRFAVDASYVTGYAFATRIGTRLGLDNTYKAVRLESAYMYDVVAHVFATKNIGQVLTGFHQWAGRDVKTSRRRGAWWGAFGMLTYMEVLNGFMPTVRFDALDVPANAAGAWMADGGQDLAERHSWMQRLSLQYGFKSTSRLFAPPPDVGLIEHAWHDYENGRWGLGYDVGPGRFPWFTLHATYEITSMDVRFMQNRFGMGIEVPVIGWGAPLIAAIPGGDVVLDMYEWVERRFITPGLYFEFFHFDTGAWSDRQPFHE